LSPETCRVKPLRRIKTQLLHLVGLISLLISTLLRRDIKLYKPRPIFSADVPLKKRNTMQLDVRSIFISKRDIQLWRRYIEVWTEAVNHNSSLLVNFHCNM